MPAALYALALGGFGIGLTEFVIMGLLPEVATDFAVTDTAAGYLISGYALSVAVGGSSSPSPCAASSGVRRCWDSWCSSSSAI